MNETELIAKLAAMGERRGDLQTRDVTERVMTEIRRGRDGTMRIWAVRSPVSYSSHSRTHPLTAACCGGSDDFNVASMTERERS